MRVILPSRLGFLATVSAVLTSAFFLSSCAVGPSGVVDGGIISKVKTTKLDAKVVRAADPAISFEKLHLLHGAITLKEKQALYGNYFAAFWEVNDRSRPVVVSFDYRLQNTKDKTHNKSVRVDHPNRSNVTHFEVVGKESQTGGPVSAWRVSVLQGGRIVATYNSFLWD